MVSLWSRSVAQVLVIGGTGTLGRRLTPLLVECGHEVRVLSRQRAPIVPAGVVAHCGDVRTGEGLATALDGVETVIQSVAATRGGKATELDGMRSLLAARGDRHVIYVSIVGVDRNPFGYYRTKLEAERLLEQSGGNWTIQRATQFHDLIDRFLGMPLFVRTPHLRFQPVATDDLSVRLAELVAAGPCGHAPTSAARKSSRSVSSTGSEPGSPAKGHDCSRCRWPGSSRRSTRAPNSPPTTCRGRRPGRRG